MLLIFFAQVFGSAMFGVAVWLNFTSMAVMGATQPQQAAVAVLGAFLAISSMLIVKARGMGDRKLARKLAFASVMGVLFSVALTTNLQVATRNAHQLSVKQTAMELADAKEDARVKANSIASKLATVSADADAVVKDAYSVRQKEGLTGMGSKWDKADALWKAAKIDARKAYKEYHAYSAVAVKEQGEPARDVPVSIEHSDVENLIAAVLAWVQVYGLAFVIEIPASAMLMFAAASWGRLKAEKESKARKERKAKKRLTKKRSGGRKALEKDIRKAERRKAKYGTEYDLIDLCENRGFTGSATGRRIITEIRQEKPPRLSIVRNN